MRKASLGTLFLTVFLDLLGFGLVVPFLPGVARNLGASRFWSRPWWRHRFPPCSSSSSRCGGGCRTAWGADPFLLWSIAASALGMTLLGFAHTLPLLFVARLFSGIATANIAVAPAYIADVTTPATRAKGMGLVGMGFGLGFIIGPFFGGDPGSLRGDGAARHPGRLRGGRPVRDQLRPGVADVARITATRAARGKSSGDRRRVFNLAAIRKVGSQPGMGVILITSFFVIFWFSGLEVTFRLFTEDAFNMTVTETGGVFAFVGTVSVIVQGGLYPQACRAASAR